MNHLESITSVDGKNQTRDSWHTSYIVASSALTQKAQNTMSRSSTNHSFPITAIAFLIINLFLLLPYTQSQTTTDPTCISIDSTHTYICTDTPDKTRLAVSSQHYNTNHYDLGVKQRISGSREELARIRKVMVDMENYFENEVMSRSEYEHVRGRW